MTCLSINTTKIKVYSGQFEWSYKLGNIFIVITDEGSFILVTNIATVDKDIRFLRQ